MRSFVDSRSPLKGRSPLSSPATGVLNSVACAGPGAGTVPVSLLFDGDGDVVIEVGASEGRATEGGVKADLGTIQRTHGTGRSGLRGGGRREN